MKTKQEILDKHIILGGRSVPTMSIRNCSLSAMEEYAEQQCEILQDILLTPTEQLKPLEDLYRKENPREDGRFYIPDATTFYKWITNKILQK